MFLEVIKKNTRDASFDDSINKLNKVDSPYLVKYIECFENEDEYMVWNWVVCKGIDSNGELWYGTVWRMHAL